MDATVRHFAQLSEIIAAVNNARIDHCGNLEGFCHAREA